jgi:hypothetical protein
VIAAEPAEPITALVAAALAIEGVVLVVLAAFAWARRMPRVEPAEPTMELGPEPPAVVDLLTNELRVEEEALPATLLDLGARGALAIEDIGGGVVVCRLGSREPRGLEPYERQLLDHVRGLAVEGIVPAAALTTGPVDRSARWWRDFRKAVVTDARERGLCRDRWDGRTISVLFVGVLAAGGALYAANRARDLDQVELTPLAVAAWSGALVLAIGLAALAASTAQRPTDAGLAATARWLGVRAHLEQNEVFPTLPAPAVVLWERHLAYGAALGLAAAAVRDLPLGAEHDKRAWSSYGRTWHIVRVRYPRIAYVRSKSPREAIGLGLLYVALGAAAAWGVLGALGPIDAELFPDVDADVRRVLDDIRRAIGLVAVVLAAWGAVVAVCGLVDIGAPRVVAGEVVRLRSRRVARFNPWRKAEKRRWFLALDDGSAREVKAWAVRSEIWHAAAQGEVVEVEVSRVLGYVSRLSARRRE